MQGHCATYAGTIANYSLPLVPTMSDLQVAMSSKPCVTLNTQMDLVLPKQRWNITSSVVHYDVELLQTFSSGWPGSCCILSQPHQ